MSARSLVFCGLAVVATACSQPPTGPAVTYFPSPDAASEGVTGDTSDPADAAVEPDAPGVDATDPDLATEDGAVQPETSDDATVPDPDAAEVAVEDVTPIDDSAIDVQGNDAVSADTPEDTASDTATDTASVDAADSIDTFSGCKSAADCDDANPCTADTCAADGKCGYAAVAGCVGPPIPCNAANPCKAGVCDPASSSCVGCLKTTDCGKPATVCANHQCKPAPACKSDIECKGSGQVCDKLEAVCVDCNSAADCSAQQACLDHACVPAPPCKSSKECNEVCDTQAGVCVQCLVGDDCPAGEFCAPDHRCAPDLCKGGGCGSKAWFFACNADGSGFQPGQSCEDSDVCTDAACDPAKGCFQTAGSAPCSDGNACTSGDKCTNGKCMGAALDCNDSNVCTVDSCDPKLGCKNAAAAPCDDGNACTDDSCNPKSGCVFVANAASCTDGKFCTEGDACSGGKCASGKPTNCNDGNACTIDACDASKGMCIFMPSDAPCSDGSACTAGDKCSNGKCIAGGGVSCSDSNPCTIDVCDTVKGCTALAGTSTCDDKNPCTLDTCNPANGQCTWAQILGCCQTGKVLWQEGFDAGLPPGTQIVNSTGKATQGWQVYETAAAKTPKNVLYYGDSVKKDYYFDGYKHSGKVTLPEVVLPPTGKRVFKAWIHFGVENYEKFDTLDIYADATNQQAKLLWNKSMLSKYTCNTSYTCVTLPEGWFEVTADVPTYLGEKVWIRIEFDTVDEKYNDKLGPMIDDVRLIWQCQ